MSTTRFFNSKKVTSEVDEIDARFKSLKVLTTERLIDGWNRLCDLTDSNDNNIKLKSSESDCACFTMGVLVPLWPISAVIIALWYLRDNYYISEIAKVKNQIPLLTGMFTGEAESYNEFLKDYGCQLENLQESLSRLKKLGDGLSLSNQSLREVTAVVTSLNNLFKQHTQKAKRIASSKRSLQAEEWGTSSIPSAPPAEVESEQPGLTLKKGGFFL